jgi:hypothetical protein
MARALVDYRLRRGTTARWVDKNPLLDQGEIGFETDTGKFKIGDGVHRWIDLPYFLNEEQIQTLIAAGGGGSGGPDARIGDMSQLSTTNQNTVVEAINEVNVPSIPLDLLYTNAKAG